MNRKGIGPEMLKVGFLALVLLLVYLAFSGKLTGWYEHTILIGRCTADIERMHRLSSLNAGDGIRCPTLHPEPEKKIPPEGFVARQMALCGQRYGLFERDPFAGTAAENICLVCSRFRIDADISNIDVALLNEQKEGRTAYTYLTGKASTTGLQTVFQKTHDTFPQEDYVVVWVRSAESGIDQWLSAFRMQRQRELWHGNLLELIPGDTVAGQATIIGAGRGIFAPDQEGLSQAILFLPQNAAENCLELDDEPWKPPI